MRGGAEFHTGGGARRDRLCQRQPVVGRSRKRDGFGARSAFPQRSRRFDTLVGGMLIGPMMLLVVVPALRMLISGKRDDSAPVSASNL